MTSAFRGARGWAAAGLLSALTMGGASSARAQDLPPQPVPLSPAPGSALPPPTPPTPGQLPPPGTVADPPPGAAAPPAGGAPQPPGGGQQPGLSLPATAESAPAGEQRPASEDTPLWLRVPPAARFPRLGNFIVTPSGAGYYSLLDYLTDDYRQAPPRWPYPRFAIMPWSFFDADFRYLENPNYDPEDPFELLKRVHLGDNFLFATGGEFRARYANEVDSRLTGVDNTYELTRTRVWGDFWYRDRFRIYAEFLSANIYNYDLPPLITDRDHGDFLNLFADVKLFNVDKYPIYFRGGRQELLLGSERLISPLDWVNTRRTFEGGRAFWHSANLDVDMFCVAPVVPNPNRFDSIDDKQVFTGLWTTYRPRAGQNIDAYYLNLDHANGAVAGLGSTPGPAYNVSTVGGRYVGDASNWLWDLEGMFQFGSWAGRSILAKAFTTGFGYDFKDVPMTPQFWVYYDYASGDPNPGSTSTHQTFNQLFPFGHYYFGMMDLVGRQNINDVWGQVAFFPTRWITTWVQYHVLRLDSPRDALYNGAGVPTRIDPTGRAGTDVGDILTYVVNFHLTTHQDLFLQYSHLYAGDFIRRTGNGRSPDETYLMYTYRW